MPVQPPTVEKIVDIAEGYGLSLTDADAASFQGLMNGVLKSYARLDALTEPTLPVTYPRTPGFRPQPEENSYNAWYWRTEIAGAPSGPLAGKTLALKDNVCVAGVPMMNGSSVLEGYTPEIDATIVTRILEAGGTILGKAVCEHFCNSGGSHTSDTGPVRNPYDQSRMSGGSSSGSAALASVRYSTPRDRPLRRRSGWVAPRSRPYVEAGLSDRSKGISSQHRAVKAALMKTNGIKPV